MEQQWKDAARNVYESLGTELFVKGNLEGR